MKKNEERIKLICQLLNEGKKIKEISTILKIGIQMAYKTKNKYLKKETNWYVSE